MFKFIKNFLKNLFKREEKIEIIEDLENNQITIKTRKNLTDNEVFKIIEEVLRRRGITENDE